MDTNPPLVPYQNKALSVPYLEADKSHLAVPTHVVSEETTHVLLTRLVIEEAEPVYPYQNNALSVPYQDAEI